MLYGEFDTIIRTKLEKSLLATIEESSDYHEQKTIMATRFVHLHCHSHYSLHNGTASPERLARRAKELGMSALALTDYCNLNGIAELCRAAKKYNIKPILGIEASVAGKSRLEKEIAFGITLLAMNKEGWQNLNQLTLPIIDTKLLQKHNAGLICLSGFAGGEVGRLLTDEPKTGYKNAKTVAQWYHKIFGDRYYLELRNHGIESQKTLFDQTIALGEELAIPTVATNDIHYLAPMDWKAHNRLLCQKNGNSNTDSDKDHPIMGSIFHYFRSTKNMLAAFAGHEAAICRTLEIADRIETDVCTQ
jgi:DNA polymerase-3 subunit alpha